MPAYNGHAVVCQTPAGSFLSALCFHHLDQCASMYQPHAPSLDLPQAGSLTHTLSLSPSTITELDLVAWQNRTATSSASFVGSASKSIWLCKQANAANGGIIYRSVTLAWRINIFREAAPYLWRSFYALRNGFAPSFIKMP